MEHGRRGRAGERQRAEVERPLEHRIALECADQGDRALGGNWAQGTEEVGERELGDRRRG
jgi:hypothetical protein